VSVDWSAHLEPGETLVWTGKPKVGWYNGNLNLAGIILMGWLFSVIGVVTFGGMLVQGEFVIAEVMPLVVGLFLLGLVKAERWDRRMQTYAVTSKRALMWHQAKGGKLFGMPLQPGMRGLLLDRSVAIEAKGAQIPVSPLSRGVGVRRASGQGPYSLRKSGLVFHDLDDPINALHAIRISADALPD